MNYQQRPLPYAAGAPAPTEKHGVQTQVFSCEDQNMNNSSLPPISIKLSPTQVDDIVRAASGGRAPSIAKLVAKVLNSPVPTDPATAPSAGADDRHLPVDSDDPRLSRSLLRGISILTCFGPDNRQRGIVELAHELGMSPSTTHRYAVTLVEIGLLERCPRTRKYRLRET